MRNHTNNLELAREICAEIQAEHQKPVLRFTLEPGEPGLRDSKIGGMPYLPPGTSWPLGSSNQPLILLAQINCTQLADLPDFPHQGILQFFISVDDSYMYGADFDDWTAQKDFRILYHAEIDPTVDLETIRVKCPHSILAAITGSDSDSEFYSPLGAQSCRICFQPPESQGMTLEDYQFDGLFLQKWNQHCPDRPLKTRFDFFKLLSPEEDQKLDEELLFGESEESLETPRHQLGGYPHFTQSDPRSETHNAEFDRLLFQLDSDYQDTDLVMWGDAGVANFWISSQDLKQLDFSHVGYNWDCC